ncbi:MAG: 4-hydroxyphenylpyruvate dioxygenase [Bdellovibrionales bacterium CG10_big_fil_rev_8_21_14_0_10_45_34]|nr:MAG: 4-hydroxyphenylpyruvate dioxygenase [Bdellovibrionales bacterium CG10_big_fil_rev_8_21_14_0_10_45_34]
MTLNPLKLTGISFVEFSDSNPESLHKLFIDFGFSKIAKHATKSIDLYNQGQITFLLNYEPDSFGLRFSSVHGPSISAMGWNFENAEQAYSDAIKRGAAGSSEGDYNDLDGNAISAIKGIGDSLIYFVDKNTDLGFVPLQDPVRTVEKGFYLIDHLTNNVFKGTMNQWAEFYKNIFGFEEVRYFDIKGKKTGLTSYALRSPCGSFCIPINEATEAKSQINEYLEEYNGPGVQHLAFLTEDLLNSLEKLKDTGIKTLDINSEYYLKVFDRVPGVKEDRESIRKFNVLVDGDADGYLLQIFTKNLVGPIFIEMIQRENHLSFGEGNFQALFESIERDQVKRGVL